MKINKLHEITFSTDETIVTATLSTVSELIMLLSSGGVIKFDIDKRVAKRLFSTKSNFGYEDGGFDATAKSTIYTLDEIVVVVNDFKRHGYIHYPEKYHALHLYRDDYHSDISHYPIALFKNTEGVSHIIYSIAWNHVQIMNLDTRQILTAAKSLIEENAEQRHIEFYKTYKEDNKLPWPRPYDYFFGKLHLAPDKKRFLSAGWAWGSYDAYNVYDMEHFINNNRIADIFVAHGEHENRAVCWIDNNTVAVAYNPLAEGDEDATIDSLYEIRLYEIVGTETLLKEKIPITDVDIVHSNMLYDEKLKSFIVLSEKIGLIIIGLDGKVKLQVDNLKFDEYVVEYNALLKVDNKTITVYKVML